MFITVLPLPPRRTLLLPFRFRSFCWFSLSGPARSCWRPIVLEKRAGTGLAFASARLPHARQRLLRIQLMACRIVGCNLLGRLELCVRLGLGPFLGSSRCLAFYSWVVGWRCPCPCSRMGFPKNKQCQQI